MKKKENLCMAAFCFAVMSAVYVQYQLPAFAGSLMQTCSLSAQMYSSIFSAPLIPSIFLSLIAGVMADRAGVMPVIVSGAAIALAGGLLRIAGRSYLPLLASMFLMGILPTFLNVNISKVLRSFYEARDVPQKMGLFYGCSMLGMALGTATSALFSGYTAAFCFGAVLLGISLVMILLAWKAAPDSHNVSTETASGSTFLQMIKNRTILCIGMVLALVMASCTALSGFLPEVLTARGVDAVNAGLYTTLFLAGNVCSTLFLPQFSVRLGLRRTALICMPVCIACVLLITVVPAGILLAAVLFMTGVSSNGLIPLCMSLPVRYRSIGAENAGSACGVLNTLQMAGGVIIPTFILIPISGGSGSGLFYACAAVYGLVLLLLMLLPEPD